MTKVSKALGAAMLCLGLLLAGIVAQQEPATPAKDSQKKAEKTPDKYHQRNSIGSY